jgi:hypothetical protein
MNNQKLFLSAIATAALILITACSVQNVAANNALQSLKKVQAATEVGINYQQYSQLLVEAQAAVNEANSKLPDGELKKELEGTMDVYRDAKWAWDISRQSRTSNGSDSFILAAGNQDLRTLSFDGVNQNKAKELLKKYSVISGTESDTDIILISTNDLLQAIWKEAQKHVNRASELIG